LKIPPPGIGWQEKPRNEGLPAPLSGGGTITGIMSIITDVVMPGMTGPELARRLTAHRPAMKVLFMSGYTDDAILHHGVLEPGTEFLQKPFTAESLGSKVRHMLDASRSEKA